MTDSTPLDRLREHITGITAMVVTGSWLAAMFLGFSWWLPFMLVGYIVIVPLVAILFGDESDIEEWVDEEFKPGTETADEPESTDTDPLADLRRRYANGELTDDQFERKLDRLLETETPEDAAEWRQRETESTRNR